FTTTAGRPRSRTIRSAACATWAASVTSQGRSRPHGSARSARERARRTTRAPAPERAQLTAAPIPREAPVITATLPASGPLISVLPAVDEIQELLAGLGVVPEDAPERAGDGAGVLFL